MSEHFLGSNKGFDFFGKFCADPPNKMEKYALGLILYYYLPHHRNPPKSSVGNVA